MISLKTIQEPVKEFVDEFENLFKNSLSSRSEWVGIAIDLLNKSTGKRVRPLLCALIAKCCAGNTNKNTLEAALVVELLHTATLIHDDVIDESKLRRGTQTLNAIFDNRVAVLLGDYVLSSAMIRAMSLEELRIIQMIAKLGKDMTEGEIWQKERADKKATDEATYMEIIRLKTARLFSVCAELGAISVAASASEQANAARIGELLGYSFQIRDDIFDYFSDDVGKPTGNDLREGKITLPLLYALNNSNAAELAKCNEILQKPSYTEEDIEFLSHFAIEKGGVEHAYQRMLDYEKEVQQLLAQFQDQEAANSIYKLADFIIKRSK